MSQPWRPLSLGSGSTENFSPAEGPPTIVNTARASSFTRASLIPPERRFVEVDVDLLGLEVILEAVRSELAAEAGLLVTAPRRLIVCRVVGVEPRNAGADRLQHADAAEDVLRPHRGG